MSVIIYTSNIIPSQEPSSFANSTMIISSLLPFNPLICYEF